MMRSMFAAISGLRNHQTWLDVIGNNIANVNTTAFKAGRVNFQDMLSQTLRGASGPQGPRGGVNAMQIGLGMSLSAIDTLQSQGNLRATGKVTDLAVQGNGFFIVGDGQRQRYTRDGSFDLATDGRLVNAAGLAVLGWPADQSGNVDTTGALGAITIPVGQGLQGQASTQLDIGGNLDFTDATVGAVTQSNSIGGTGTVTGTYTAGVPTNYVVRIAAVDPAGNVTSAEVSTDGGATFGAPMAVGANGVDLGNGLRLTIGGTANNAVGNTYSVTATPPVFTTSVTAYDSLGIGHQIQFTFQRAAANNAWTWQASSNEAGVTIAPATATPITFGSDGRLAAGQTMAAVSLTLGNGATSPQALELDLSNLSQLAGNGEVTSLADGAPPGNLTTFTVGAGGDIIGIYSNGQTRTLGQLALANFANPAGLTKDGGNIFDLSANSGNPQIGLPDSAGRGVISAGFLESSNVDLAQQFTEMIMAQRGFQADSRVITTSDDMLQELVNLKGR